MKVISTQIFGFLILLFSFNAFGQQTPPSRQWGKTLGSSGWDELQKMRPATGGGYMLGGYSNGDANGEKSENSRGSFDFWIIRTDERGNKIWDKTYGGSGDDKLYDLQETSDGGWILGGISYSNKSGEKSENSRGGYDFWVIKIDISGNLEWDKTIGGKADDKLYSIQQTQDGGYILGGWSASDISGEKSQSNRGIQDYWVVKLDEVGNIIWDKTLGGNNLDELRAVKQTTDGGYILGGWSASDIGDEKSENNRGGNDYWIVKIDGFGNKQWDKTFGGSANDHLPSEGLQLTRDGGYILGGSSFSGKNGDKSEMSRGTPDYWVVKTDALGNKQWDKTIGGYLWDDLRTVHQTADGGYMLGGFSNSRIGYEKSENSYGGNDYWIVKIDSTGRKEGDKIFGGTREDNLLHFLATPDGGYILGGASSSSRDYYDKTQNARGGYDFWIVKLGCPPSALIIPPQASVDLCGKESILLTADASQGVKFQWYKDQQKIAGANTRFYSVTEPGGYRVRVGTNLECSQLSRVISVINSCNDLAASVFTISPNPGRSLVYFEYRTSRDERIKITVFDKTGRVVFSKVESAIKGLNIYHADLSNLINGLYQVQLATDNITLHKKLVMQK